MLTLQEILNDYADYVHAEPSSITISSRNASGESPLHWMASLGDALAIRLLIINGADPSDPDHFGNTALHIAVLQRHAPAAKELIHLGAPMHTKNGEGTTPADIAAADNYQPTRELFAAS